MALTGKQKAFCEHYITNGFNATQAALSAGYKEKNAGQQGCENLVKPEIAQYIYSFKKEAAKRALVTTEDVAEGLLLEAKGSGIDSTPSSRVSAWKTLSDYTGGFDSNKVHNVNVEMSHEEWLSSLK